MHALAHKSRVSDLLTWSFQRTTGRNMLLTCASVIYRYLQYVGPSDRLLDPSNRQQENILNTTGPLSRYRYRYRVPSLRFT
jgi:hypothetical protein